MLEILVHPELSPRIIEILPPTTSITLEDLYRAIRDWEDDEGMSYPRLVDGAGKEDLGAGLSVGITATLQNAKIMFTGRREKLTSGTVSVTDATGTVLTDSFASFLSDDIISGSTALNVTTSETAPIRIIHSTQLTSFPLSGSTPTSPGWTSGDSYEIYPNVQMNITVGNLVAIDLNGATIESIFPSPNTSAVRSTATAATLQELSAVEHSSFNQGVAIDVLAPNVNILFPSGTTQQPVNNLVDAKTIAAERGFARLFILGDFTFESSDNIDSFEIFGESPSVTEIILTAGCSTINSEFINCTLTGTVSGAITASDCHINNLDNLGSSVSKTVLNNCLMDDSVYLIDPNATQPIYIIHCIAAAIGHGGPIFDLTDSNASMRIKAFVGGVAFANITTGTFHSVEISSGHVFVFPSCTQGSVTLHGLLMLDDTSGVNFGVDITGVENRDTFAIAVWDEIIAGHQTLGTAGRFLSSGSSGGLSATETADAVWNEPIQSHLTPFTTGGELYSGSAGIDADATATAVWGADVDDHKVTGSFGQWFRKIFWGGKRNT